MNRRTDYTFATLLTERQAAIDSKYKHDIRMAFLCFPLVCAVAWLILAMF